MFYKVKVKDHIRVPPDLFGVKRDEAIVKRIRKDYEGYISAKMGFVVDVVGACDIKDGVIVPGDGAAFYETEFELITFKPLLQEVVRGKVRDIADFGVFLSLGPAEGMIHISQTMDDFVSFSKEKTLTGKESGRVLRPNDKCQARIIAVSFKDPTNPKIGLTMRQEGLGRLEWLEEEPKKEVKKAVPKKGGRK